MSTVPNNYVPSNLSRKERKKQMNELKKSRKNYKKKKFNTRKKIKGYKNKKSKWISLFQKKYNLKNKNNLSLKEISKASKCSKKALQKIIKKGMGAYYSSGSRPNQTAHSWGKARMYSALTGGPASRVDKAILIEGCKKTSKSLKFVKTAKKSNNYKKIKLKGGTRKSLNKMKEILVEIEKSPIKYKKYRAVITSDYDKYRTIDFGDNRYQQYNDSTKLKLYKKLNHGDPKRRENYFSRHSGVSDKKDALKKEIKKSKGKYNAKILSHEYLW
ncbi:hypothetical protein N9O88_01360 [bacterium]|nr:hypothetical protein [bacterium]